MFFFAFAALEGVRFEMGKIKKMLNGESSSNPDINETIVPKPEMLDPQLQSDAMYSRQLGDTVASSSGSNLRSFFTGMGFSPSLVGKVIEENGEDNVDLLLKILMECSSRSQPSDSPGSLFDDKDASSPKYFTFVQPKEEPDVFGVDDDKRASLLRMNFSVEEVDFAMEKLNVDASIDEIVDFIIATQVAADFNEETNDKLDNDAEINEDFSNEILFGTMEKTLRLLEMGFSENEISLAIERFGAEVPVLELANSICAEQVGEKYIIEDKYSLKRSRMNCSRTASYWETFSVGMESNKLKTEDFDRDAVAQSSNLNLNMEEVRRGKRPKQEHIEDYPDTQLGHIGFVDNYPKPEFADESSSYFKPTWVEEKVNAEIAGFRIPRAPKSNSCKSVDRMVAKPPYFFYGNVATASFDTWSKISRFLYAIEPEFVDTRFFSALSRKEGYVHNLPTERRFHILPKPPMSIEDAIPHTKKWWPSWDMRKQLSCVNFETNGVSQLCDRLGRILADSRGFVPSERNKRDILHHCQKLNLVWVGPYKLGPIEPEYLEIILGYPSNHTQAAESNLIERLHSLRYSFQIDTLGYHLSVLKSMFPDGITMLSVFSGIGGAEVAIHRLGIHMKGVVSVETSETKREMLRRWWHSSGQTGELEQIEGIQKLTSNRIDRLIDKFGGLDFIICQSPCNSSSRSPKMDPEGDAPSDFDFSLFCEFVRVLQRVRSLIERKSLWIASNRKNGCGRQNGRLLQGGNSLLI
ncbi:probable inactive DNA (cytosine-5)-methyltransferase DRM3 isoform X1 [Hevea brasiliensis]|uniref:probable inactive DNA (cytosine-5)-methyltransferase DRM3 isoform X1 n=1 Tax=Hevea brasiliensis TaxID=3981 RepID=UPI0025F71D39|nr:probable inactive DNA (cytosine-5)-methyltransferase DRM3 isoform X1 [Hevea brasiliensis]